MDEREREGLKAAINRLQADIAEIQRETEILADKRDKSAKLVCFFEERISKQQELLIRARKKKLDTMQQLEGA